MCEGSDSDSCMHSTCTHIVFNGLYCDEMRTNMEMTSQKWFSFVDACC